MKKNIVTYLLIVVVLVVWGIVFYNLFSPSDKNKIQPAVSSVQERKKEDKRPLLSLGYRNPFRVRKVENRVEAGVRPVEIPREPPAFRYKGFIQGAKNNVIIIEKNGVSEVIRLCDSVSGYKLISINKDSVVLRRNGIRYSLLKD